MENNSSSSWKAHPILIGNGEICIMADEEGTVCMTDAYKKACTRGVYPDKHVFHAGRRMYINARKNIQGNLIPFGSFSFDCGAVCEDFTQSLELPDGYVKSICHYDDGSVIDSVYFVHCAQNLYVLRKTYHGKEKDITYTFNSDFCHRLVKLILHGKSVRKIRNGFRIGFTMDGMDTYNGNMTIFTDHTAVCTQFSEDMFTLKMHVKDGETFTFCYGIADDADGQNPLAVTESFRREMKNFDALFTEHKALWNRYFDKGYVRTGDEQVDRIYKTALYHFKCITTKWSIPVCLNDRVWHGNYFGFDEYYGFYGLLTSGRFELAERVPAFRVRNCLKKAVSRATNYSAEQARFMWETTEYGDENSPFGPWMDHVFHMAVIAQGAFEYYEFTKDKQFLDECYGLIRACAEFYSLNMIYRDEKRGVYFGKCCDLERLGSPVENAFMSSCGAICTFRQFARAAKILERDEKYRLECQALADELEKNLPQNGERYLPFDGAEIRSIGVFAGKFPFNTLDKDDKKLLAAFSDFTEHEDRFGNMYRVGKGVSSWYSAWKAEGYARCGMTKETVDSLAQARISCGKFGEMYEINEVNVVTVPWFMTAAGVYVSAVNESLIQSDDDRIYIQPASDEPNVSFKLAVKGGAMCEVKIENGTLSDIRIDFLNGVTPKKYRVFFRGNEISY